MMNVLILPGLGGSGAQHWQTFWEQKNPTFHRVNEPDWDHPCCEVWVRHLEEAIKQSGAQTILVAHSLACLQVIHWAAVTKLKVQGAFLVAPPNPDRPGSPPETADFKPVPQIKLNFPSILVASDNDPYADVSYFQRCAQIWGSRYVNAGALGHINAASGIDDWPQGFELLQSLFP